MTDAERPAGKRSRFDQKEPEPRKASRFDRRSRSPQSHRTEARERSPLADDAAAEVKRTPEEAAAMAVAAAARIAANVQARKGIQHVDVPPVNKPPESAGAQVSARTTSTSTAEGSTCKIDGEMYVADGDYIKDIEVNDLRNRYTLTKGSTQKMIKDLTGADVTTRGSYYPNKAMATPANPPLYLHITSTSKDGLDAAVAKIDELIQQELPQLVDERRFRRREQQEQPQVERDEYGRRKWPEEKIPVGLESVPGFNLRAQIVGSGGSYVKHIQSVTGCRVQIKGRGSGYIEFSTNRETDEDMFLHVTGPDAQMVEKGKELCEDLVANVREQFEEFKSRPPRNHHDRGGYNDNYRGGRSQDQSSYPPYGRHGSEGAPAPASSGSPATTAAPAGNADWSQYASYYNGSGADPYAAYGGYQNYVAWYQYYYSQQAAQVAGGQGAPGASPAPPPPPSESAPPPPPPDTAPAPPPSASPPPPPPPSNGYNAIPPPPGL